MPSSSTLYLLFVLPAAQCFEAASWSLAAAAQILPQWLWSPPTPTPPTHPLLSEDEVIALIDGATRPPVDGRELSEVSPPASATLPPAPAGSSPRAGPSSYGEVDIEQPMDETFTQRV